MIHKHIANKLETTSQNAMNHYELSSEEHDSLKHLNATSPPKIEANKYMSSLLPNDNAVQKQNQTMRGLSFLGTSENHNNTYSQDQSQNVFNQANKNYDNLMMQARSTQLLALELQQISCNDKVTSDQELMATNMHMEAQRVNG